MKVARSLVFFALVSVVIGAGTWMACNTGTDAPETMAAPAGESAGGSVNVSAQSGGASAGEQVPPGASEVLRGLSGAELLGFLGEESGRVLSSYMTLDDYDRLRSRMIADMRKDDSFTEDERLLLIHYFHSIERGMSGQFDPKYPDAARAVVRELAPSITEMEAEAEEMLSIFREQIRKGSSDPRLTGGQGVRPPVRGG